MHDRTMSKVKKIDQVIGINLVVMKLIMSLNIRETKIYIVLKFRVRVPFGTFLPLDQTKTTWLMFGDRSCHFLIDTFHQY